MFRKHIVFTCISLLLPTLVGAQEVAGKPSNSKQSDWDISLGLGAGVKPTFEGSDRYSVQAMPLVNVVYKDMISLGINGLNAYWRNGPLRIGAGLTYNSGRPDSKENGVLGSQGDDRLRGMGGIDTALGLKAFASYRLGIVDVSASVTKYTGGNNNGVVSDVGIAMPYRLTNELTVTPHTGLTWGNRDYMQTFFGVTSAQSANSGFAKYSVGAGIKDIKAGIDANYRLDKNWFLNLRTDVKQLVGKAADSPISFSDTGVTAMAAIGYRF